LGEGAEFQLVGDAQTKFEGSLFANGGSEVNASYMIAVKDDEGRWRLQLADDGQPRRLAFEVTDMQQELVLSKAENANLNTRLGQLQTQLGNTTDPSEQFKLEQEITRLAQQRNALDENAKVITGVDTPEQQINSLQKIQTENESNMINAQWRLSVAKGQGNETVIKQIEQEIEKLETQAEQLRRRLGDTDG
jgi:predicted  nucleic acid-binding Zn-ribbon protein